MVRLRGDDGRISRARSEGGGHDDRIPADRTTTPATVCTVCTAAPATTAAVPTDAICASGRQRAGRKTRPSIAALVLGCSSVIFYFTVFVPLLAIVFAGLAMSAQRKAGQKVNEMATVSPALGIVFLVFGLFFVLFAAG